MNLDDYEELCSGLRSNKIYSTNYGQKFVNHIYKKISPPISYGGLPNVRNFFYEIRPIIRAAKYLKFSHFIYFGDNFPFDGLLINKLNKKIRHIECTQAIDGQRLYLTNHHTIKYGDAPLFNKPLTNQQSKVSGKLEILDTESELVSDNDIVMNLRELIQNALLKKLEPNKYDFKNGILSITFEQFLPHLNENIEQMLKELIMECHQQIKESAFNNIIIGSNRSFFYPSKVC